jgi:hypothetical protein
MHTVFCIYLSWGISGIAVSVNTIHQRTRSIYIQQKVQSSILLRENRKHLRWKKCQDSNESEKAERQILVNKLNKREKWYEQPAFMRIPNRSEFETQYHCRHIVRDSPFPSPLSSPSAL